jgi:hypothetical protein
MIRTIEDIQTEVLVRGARTTSATDITDQILNDWTRDAYNWVCSYKKWPMTEGRASTTYASVEELVPFEGWKSDSIRILTIGGERYEKKNFADYQMYREDYPAGDDKIFSDFAGLYFINVSAAGSGTLTAYGQFTPAIDPTDKEAQTVFSNSEEDGNEAVVEMMLSYLKKRDKLFDEAILHKTEAMRLLEGIWKSILDEQYAYQTKNRGMFKRFDVLEGGEDYSKEDQF